MTKRKLKKKAKLSIILMILGFILIGLYFIYINLSSPVDKTSNVDVEVTIEKGTSTAKIAKKLKDNNLIKSEFLFNVEAKICSKKSLKASVYQLRRNMGLKEIVSILTDGSSYDPDIIKITFTEGETAKKMALQIAESTNNSYDDVINKMTDTTYLKELMSKYWFLSNEILDTNIYIPLEGYLAPNTYEFKNKDVSISKIIEVMLNQTKSELNQYQDTIKSSNYTPHQYLTIASILELEGKNTTDRKMIAGVFNNRLNANMNLGSDVTTYYALQREMNTDLTSSQFAVVNPYNTRAANMGGKLPIGPICNPSLSSIEASINPTNNDYLYFVADKYGKIYYTKSEAEHLKKVEELKESGDWIW